MDKLTWIDFVHDRDIWRMVVLNKFNTFLDVTQLTH